MAAVQQSAEALIQERRAILKDLLVMINEYDPARHGEVKDELAEKFIHYSNIIASQQKNRADALERADLFLSDLILEMALCLKICSDDNDREKKIRDIDSTYYRNRKFSDPTVPVDPKDAKAREEQTILELSITEFYQAVPSMAIKVPNEIKALVKKVLKELENCPKKNQEPYEKQFNSILMDILNNISDANKQNECKDQLTKLSEKIVDAIHKENTSRLAEIDGKKLGSVYDSLKQLPPKIEKIPLEQRGEYEIQFKHLLTKTLDNAQACRQKEKEYKKAVANEKSRHILRTVAIVSVGVAAIIGLAVVSIVMFGATLPHAFFLGGLGIVPMTKTLEYSNDKKDKNLRQLRSYKDKFIQEATENIAQERGNLLRALDTPKHPVEARPQPRESNISQILQSPQNSVERMTSLRPH